MTNRYLLAAEADKIQDFIFRAAHLREVVGGSQLLVRFCQEAPRHLGIPKKDIVVGAGGSFRILFDSEQAARGFGEQLAEMYRRAADGALTVAEPQPVNGDYGSAAQHAEEALRGAKRSRADAESSPQLPITAFCANCGSGLAAAYARRHDKESAEQHLCNACLAKAAERAGERKAGAFLEQFYALVTDGAQPDALHWPGREPRRDTDEYDPVEDVADYDSRRYVAYLVADGNNMGEIFGLCRSEDQVRLLSTGLDAVVQAALAEPTQLAMTQPARTRSRTQSSLIPVLPLILGGDDVFALLPAPWALDFAARFCRRYEQGMQELLAGEQFASVRAAYAQKLAKRTGAPVDETATLLQPTMAAAVVICKASHPYALAHEAGHAALKEAKRAIKLLAEQQPLTARSAVNFEIILGGQLNPSEDSGSVRTTLRPYWSAAVPEGWGLPLDQLLDHRLALVPAPNKRIAALRELFDAPLLPQKVDDASQAAWRRRLAYLLGRIERRSGAGAAVPAAVLAALRDLGDGRLGSKEESPTSPWRRVQRGLAAPAWHGHGLPDLIEAWDYTLRLDRPRGDYMVEE